MATQLNLDPETQEVLDDMVASGRFPSPEEAVREGLRLVSEQDGPDEVLDLDALDPDDRAAIERGLDDIDAGRVYPADQVFAELRERYRNWR